MRIEDHPILGKTGERTEVHITVDGKTISAIKGEPILAALLANGIRVTRHTKSGRTRGFFCGIGRCTDCIMTVDGKPNIRTCVTPVEDGMTVISPKGNEEMKPL